MRQKMRFIQGTTFILLEKAGFFLLLTSQSPHVILLIPQKFTLRMKGEHLVMSKKPQKPEFIEVTGRE